MPVGQHLHAQLAIDAVAEADVRRFGFTLARAAVFATGRIVGDGQRVFVEHHALEPRIRAHVHAHRFAQPAGVEVSGGGEEQHPEQAHAAHLPGQQFAGQRPNGCEVTDKGQPGQHADTQPQRMFGRAPCQFVQAPGCRLQLDTLVALAFGDLFAPHEQPGERALRAGVAAPHPAGEHGDRKQAEGADDQQRRQQDEVLRPERGAEYVELAFGQVPQYGLATAPVQPHRAEKRQEQKACTSHAQGAVQAGEATGMDLVIAGFGLHLLRVRRLVDFHGSDGDHFAHGHSLISLHQAGELCRRAVCITDSGVAIKSGSDALQRPCCDNALHPVAPGGAARFSVC